MTPEPWATTSQILVTSAPGKVHVTPASELRARPHDVPTKTLRGSSGSIAIPKADGCVRSTLHRPAGGDTAGWVQVAPLSALTLISDRGLVRPSNRDVA